MFANKNIWFNRKHINQSNCNLTPKKKQKKWTSQKYKTLKGKWNVEAEQKWRNLLKIYRKRQTKVNQPGVDAPAVKQMIRPVWKTMKPRRPNWDLTPRSQRNHPEDPRRNLRRTSKRHRNMFRPIQPPRKPREKEESLRDEGQSQPHSQKTEVRRKLGKPCQVADRKQLMVGRRLRTLVWGDPRG